MNDGGWAQQLGCHACPRHSAHLCRHFPHSFASTRRRQLQVALESLRPANDDAGGREDWRAGEEINSCGSGPVQGEGLMCMARRAEAVRSRTIHSARPAGVSRVNANAWFHGRFHSGNNRNSVPLRELPPQRGPRQFSVER